MATNQPFLLKFEIFFARLFSRKGNKPAPVMIPKRLVTDATHEMGSGYVYPIAYPSRDVIELMARFGGRLWQGCGEYAAILPNDSDALQFTLLMSDL